MSSNIIRERSTGHSHGYGFVEYATEMDAANAIQSLNGIQLENKFIKVAYSRQGKVKRAKLYVRGLPLGCRNIELEQLFSSYGDIVESRVFTRSSQTDGFVLFSLRKQAKSAMAALNNVTPPGFPGPLVVQFADDSEKHIEKRPTGAAPVNNPIQPQHSVFTGPPLGVNNPIRSMQSVFPGYPLGVNNPIQPQQSVFAGHPFGSFPQGFGNNFGMMNAPIGNFTGPVRNQMSKQQRFNPMAIAAGYGACQGAGRGGDNSGIGHEIFVYNIGPNTNESQLWELFANYGTVLKSSVIRDPNTNAGRGYGFITMPNYQEAQFAIKSLNGCVYSTKPLQVSFKSAKTGSK